MSKIEEVAADTAHSAVITDHAFSAPEGKPWALCTTCNLSRATHLDPGEEYPISSNYRCPDCVTKDVEVCSHGRNN